MYGALKPHKSAQSSRHNLKFFDSTDLASGNNNQENTINNFTESKTPAYFVVSGLLRNDENEVRESSILKNSKFGNLPIKMKERNIRHNIKFFNSIEMQRSQSEQNDEKLPGYFQVNDALQTMDQNSKQTTKLFI